ncbi:unnamed protein product, partial [Amoebophrya sp. A25]
RATCEPLWQKSNMIFCFRQAEPIAPPELHVGEGRRSSSLSKTKIMQVAGKLKVKCAVRLLASAFVFSSSGCSFDVSAAPLTLSGGVVQHDHGKVQGDADTEEDPREVMFARLKNVLIMQGSDVDQEESVTGNSS